MQKSWSNSHAGGYYAAPGLALFAMVFAVAFFSLCRTNGFAQNAPPLQANPKIDRLPQTKEKIIDWTRARFWNGNFKELDEAAQVWRESKEEFADGSWKLDYMYRALKTLTDKAEGNARWLELAKKWVRNNPDSITARITVSMILNSLAWRVRGRGYADTVTEEGEAAMQAYLKESWEVLLEAAKLKAKCPYWWVAGHTVALGQGWDREEYMAYFNMAVEFEPECYEFYSNAMYYLLPRWYGKAGESQTFLLQATSKVPGEKGDILYARLLGSLFLTEPEQSYEGGLTSFEKIDRGYVALRKKYPNYTQYYTIWAALCFVTGTPENEAARKRRAREILAAMNRTAPDELAHWEAGQVIQEWANTP